MSWKFFIPTLKAFLIGQVEAMLMVMYDGDGVLLKESTYSGRCTWRISDV